MSKSSDIRSFFTVVSSNKKSLPSTATPLSSSSKKRTKTIVSSDEDNLEIVPATPTPVKKSDKTRKRRKVNVINSDSEDENTGKNKTRRKEKKNKINLASLKSVNALDVFGTAPVKQSNAVESKKIVEPVTENETANHKRKNKKSTNLNTEVGIHNDINFEKTLLDLDEELLLENLEKLEDFAEKTFNENTQGRKVTKTLSKGSSTVFKSTSSESDSKANKSGTSEDSVTKTPKRKQATNHSDTDPDQERYEKRQHSAILYQKYLNRSGPAHHGSKELPQGKPDCLRNLCILRTGVLDSLTSEEFETLIKDHGGRVVQSVSKKVNYVVAGEDPGPAKLEKANKNEIKVINEDELLDLIRTKSGQPPIYIKAEESTSEISNTYNQRKETDTPKEITKKETHTSEELKKEKAHSSEEIKKLKTLEVKKIKLGNEVLPSKQVNKTTKQIVNKLETESKSNIERETNQERSENLAWTEKYKPKGIKEIIGQQGDKSNMKRLLNWLQKWHKNHSGKNKPTLYRTSSWTSNDDGSCFKAALLSGSPGVGKTTTATLVAKELGFDVVEFNASDTRSKKLLHEEVSQLLKSKSLAGFISGGPKLSSKRVLLMDEVDGMAGNEDRGGVQELITLIKDTRVPIICMCNDRNHQKIRSLANYCMDLRFSKPRLEQIRGAMMSICFKEGVQIKPDALSEVINGAGMDIRQILTHLCMWSATEKALSVETAAKEAKLAKKDTPLGPWEVCRKVFSEEEHKTMTISDRSRLFYYDYSLAPLFVQENYLKVEPHTNKNEFLARFSAAADSISMGDIIDTKIRRTNNWSLLDVEAFSASVLPGYYVRGHMKKQIDFPSWLGKNSKKNKFNRLLSELQAHMRISISGSRTAVNLDYVSHICDSIVRPLAEEQGEGVNKAVEVMQMYNLLREDLDSLLVLAKWPQKNDPMVVVESKVKAAFTKAYNKKCKLLYAVPQKKKATNSVSNENFGDDAEGDVNSGAEDDDISKDAMIKLKKPSSKESGETSKRGKRDNKKNKK